jgi:uncharacterized membrane protein (UPF0127 family)
VPRPHFLEPLLKKPEGAATLVVARPSGDAVLATTVESALDSASRNRGLLGRDGLAAGHALVIAPTSAIHTFGMRFPIDIVFAARDGRVVKIARAVPRGRIRVALGAFAVIEMTAGEADKAGVKIGDTLAIRRA